MKTQTAIEWFQSQIINIVNGDCELSEIEIFEQAKAMEKEQRFKDFKQGFHSAFESLEAANNSVQSKTFKLEQDEGNNKLT